MNSPRILTLDIETAPMLVYSWGLFDQNIGINQIVDPIRVISWAAKWHGEKKVLFASEHHDGHEPMVERIYELVDEADIVVHFNGTSFDMPHLRREFALMGLAPYRPVQEIDLYRVVKSRFKFPSNKLDYIAQQLGVGGKTAHTGFDLWRKCLAGDDKAWALMRKYNMNDVVITEKVYDEMRPHMKNHPHAGLFSLSGQDVCARCGSGDLKKRGLAYTPLAVFQQLRCESCGSWSRSGKALDRVDVRATA